MSPRVLLPAEIRVFLLHAACWVLVLASGLALLHGRFDFVTEQTFAWRSYVTSGFFLVLTLPTAYYLLAAAPLRRVVRLGLTALLFIVLTLPWQWLELERHPVEISSWEPPQPAPVPTFFPMAWLDEGQ